MSVQTEHIISYKSALTVLKSTKKTLLCNQSLCSASAHLKGQLCTAVDWKIFGDYLVCQHTEYSAHSNGFAKAPTKESSSCTISTACISSTVIKNPEL